MALFLDRKNELNSLEWLLNKKTASFVVIKGRRRIGKTTLIEHFCENHKTASFVGIPPNKSTTKQSQLDTFSKQAENEFSIKGLKFNDWVDALNFVADQTSKGRYIITLDEISWIGSKDKDFMGKLKTCWDKKFKKNDKLILIVCGSVSAWIENNILMNTGFVGRISSQIKVDELSLNACTKFWGKYSNRVSNYEKLKILSITGGVPRYLEELRPELSAEENIKELCFNKSGFLFSEFERIFNDSLISNTAIHKKILLALKQNKLEPKELSEKINAPLNGVFISYIDELVQAGFITREHTWSIKTASASKLSKLRISDNYIRFYLSFIEKNKGKISDGLIGESSIASLPGWNTIMGLQFENLVLNNRRRLLKLLKIPGEEVIYQGPYFQTHTKKTAGCQIDYMVQTKYNTLYIVEIKFSQNELKKTVVESVEQKVRALKTPKNFTYRTILVHINGVSDSVIDSEFFTQIINFGQLLEE